MTSCTKGNANKYVSVCKKLHVEKLGYTVKFHQTVQSSNAVSSSSLLPNVSSSRDTNEVRHKDVTE